MASCFKKLWEQVNQLSATTSFASRENMKRRQQQIIEKYQNKHNFFLTAEQQ